MMGINWKVRFRHKTFWISLIALLSVLLNQLAPIFNFDITIINKQLTGLTETVLMILVLLGIVVDPTTDGIKDSDQALSYTQPRKSGNEQNPNDNSPNNAN